MRGLWSVYGQPVSLDGAPDIDYSLAQMRMKRTLGALALAVGMAVLAAPAAQAAPTRDEYIEQIEPICQSALPDYLDAVDAGLAALKRKDLDRGALKFAEASSIFRDTFQLVQQIEPPTDDAALISAWIALELREAKTLRRYAAALSAGKAKKAVRCSKAGQHINELVDDLMGGYGLTDCA